MGGIISRICSSKATRAMTDDSEAMDVVTERSHSSFHPNRSRMVSKYQDDLEDDLTASRQSHLVTRSSSVRTNIHEDILIQIFLILSRDPDCTSIKPVSADIEEGWDWICVTEVCRHWRAIAMGAPLLWSYLHPQTFRSARRTSRFLLLSRNSDLTVDFAYNSMKISEDLTSLKTVLLEIQRVRHLWITIYIRNKHSEELLPLIDQLAPRLESMTINILDFSDKPIFQLPITSPGILQRVELAFLKLSFGMCRLSRLTSLCVTRCDEISLPELLTVLETSPMLSSLTLLYCEIHSSPITKLVQLPYLVNFHMESTLFSAIYHLLSSIEAPSILRRIVGCEENLTFSDVGALSILSKLLKRESNFSSIFITSSSASHGDTSWIHIRTTEETRTSDFDEIVVELPFHPEDLDEAFQALVKVFGNHLARAGDLNTCDISNPLSMPNWCRLLCASVCAKTIRVRIGDRDDALNSLKALGLHLPVRSGVEPKVPCPALDYVSIHRVGLESDLDPLYSVLLDMLKSRSMHGSALRKLSVSSYYCDQDDERSRQLSQWVEEFKWTLDLQV